MSRYRSCIEIVFERFRLPDVLIKIRCKQINI